MGEGGSNAALFTFGCYTLVVFAVAYFSRQLLAKKTFLSEYFLGSRGLGAIAFTLTVGATSASAGSFGGFPALIYTHGWILALWISSYMVVPICVMGLLGKRMNQVARKTGAITLPDVMRERFNSRAMGLLSTIVLVFLLSFYLVPQFKVAALILRTLLRDVPLFHRAGNGLAGVAAVLGSVDGEYLLCLILFAILVIFYTTYGGFRAVVWTDVLQGVVMVCGVVIMLLLALTQVGGLRQATEQMSRMVPPRIGAGVFVADRPVDESGVRIDNNTWILLPANDSSSRRLLHTNQAAFIRPGETSSEETKLVEIVTPEEVTRILDDFPEGAPPPLPDGVDLRIQELNEYAYGANQPGVYVTGPGPSPSSTAGFLPLGLAISFFFYWAISGTGQPGTLVRLMAFDRTATLRRGIALLAVYFGLIYFPLVIIFCCARVLVPGLDQEPDGIMPATAVSLSNGAGVPWLAGLLVAAPFSAAISTVDSFMLIISSAFVRDVYQRSINPDVSQRTVERLSYACTLLIGLVAMLGAVNPPKFLQYIVVFASGGLAVAFLFPVALALYWQRFNTAGAIAGMLGGLVAYLGLYIGGFIYFAQAEPIRPLELDPLLWGFAASALCSIVVALRTQPPPSDLVERYFGAGR